MQINPNEIKTFFKLMDLYNAEVVIGNKHHQYSESEYTLTRQIVSKGYYCLVKLLFGLPLRDTQCGFKLFRRRVLDKLIPFIKENRFSFDLEIIVALRDNHIRIVDSPVSVRKQKNQGSVSLKSIWWTFIDTLRIWYRRQKGWYVLHNNSL
jgi:hypothetical protein